MSALDLFFGGVGATQPRYGRGLPCIIVRVGRCIVMFDVGEGCQESYALFGLGMNKPLYVFISHGHGDHLLGLRPLLESMALNNRAQPVYVYLPLFSRDYVLGEMQDYGFPLYIREIARKRGSIELPSCGARVSYQFVPHYRLSYAFSLETEERVKLDPLKLERDGIYGPLRKKLLEEGVVSIGGEERLLDHYVASREPGIKVTYSGDTLPSHRLISLARGSDILIHEATLTTGDWERKPGIPHSTPYYAARAALLSRSKLLVLFHLGGRYSDPGVLLREAVRVFPRTLLAEKGMSISISYGMPRRFYISYGFRAPSF